MKKYIYLLTLATMVLFTGCDDELELEPFDAIGTNNAFKTNEDFNNAIRGSYAFLRDADYYGGEFILFPDIYSDNAIINSEGRTSYQDYYFFNVNGNIAWLDFWSAGYDVILRANHVLENIDNLEDGEFKNNIQGQALALRAMAHFDLARVYAKAPQFAGSSDLGIPYVTTTDASEKPERPTVAATFASIEQDLLDAANLIGSDNGVSFFNLVSVHALLSRFYLYTGDMDKTITSADNAIAQTIAVSALDQFPEVWTDETDAGVLFKVKNTDNDNRTVGVVYNQTGPTGVRSEYNPDFPFYQQFGTNDVRRDSYFSTSAFAGIDFNHVVKWFSRPGSNQGVVDIKVLRASEVYLNKAEAHASRGEDAAALAALDAVREQRYTGFVSPGESGAALVDAIALERRLEFAFEGHRMFELKRKNQDIVRSGFGDYADGTGISIPEEFRELPASSDKFQFPIPQEELNANLNMQPNPSNG